MPELTNAWIESIGIVDGPANKRRLLLLKADRPIARSVVSFRSYPKVESDSWSWSSAAQDAIINGGGWEAYKAAHTYFDPDADSETKAAYKLPHHVWDGELKTHRKGVIAAMAALLGSRGGVDMPESEKQAAYNHLARHYREFDMEPPELRKSDDAKEDAVADEIRKDDVEQPSGDHPEVKAPESEDKPKAEVPEAKAPEQPEASGAPEVSAPVEKSAEVVALEKRLEALEKRAEKAEEKATKTEEVLKAERDERATQEHIRKAAKDYRYLTVKAEEFGPIMKAAQDALPAEQFEEIERALRAADEAVRKSGVFNERGVSDRDDEGGESVQDQIERKARELVEKGTCKNLVEARVWVTQNDSELRKEFAKSRR